MLGCLTGFLITHLTTSCLVSNLLFHDFSYSYKGKCHIYNQVYFRTLAVKIFPSKKNLYQVKIILNELTPAPGSQLESKDFPSSSLPLDLLTSLFEPCTHGDFAYLRATVLRTFYTSDIASCLMLGIYLYDCIPLLLWHGMVPKLWNNVLKYNSNLKLSNNGLQDPVVWRPISTNST